LGTFAPAAIAAKASAQIAIRVMIHSSDPVPLKKINASDYVTFQ
jgi:hypothetical protein